MTVTPGWDSYGRLYRTEYQIDGFGIKTYGYAYGAPDDPDFGDNRLKTVTLPNNVASTLNFDGLGRLSCRVLSNGTNLSEGYTYEANGTRTTSYVSRIQYNSNGVPQKNLKYEYNNAGNIKAVKNGDNSIVSSYEYDGIGRLIRENINGSKTVLHDYDAGGNLLNRKEYAYSISSTEFVKQGTPSKTYAYEYSVGTNRDQLMKFNGKDLVTGWKVPNGTAEQAYDGIGNPKYWFKTANGETNHLYTLTWTHGRNLSEIADTAGNKTYSYEYNDSGIRTSKTENGTTYQYILDGGTIIAETRTTGSTVQKLFYYYDASGVCGFNYTGSDGISVDCYYRKNLQCDIIEILDEYGHNAGSYTYDAWGNILSATGDMAAINLFRYRGYYYDTDMSQNCVSSKNNKHIAKSKIF